MRPPQTGAYAPAELLESVGTLPLHPVRAARKRLPRGAEWPCRSAPGAEGREHSGSSCVAPDRSSVHTLAARWCPALSWNTCGLATLPKIGVQHRQAARVAD